MLESALLGEDLRYLYREMNHAVHIGPTRTTNRVDFTRIHPVLVRHEFDLRATARTGWTASRLVLETMELTTSTMTALTKNLDDILPLAPALESLESAISLFQSAVERTEPGGGLIQTHV